MSGDPWLPVYVSERGIKKIAESSKDLNKAYQPVASTFRDLQISVCGATFSRGRISKSSPWCIAAGTLWAEQGKGGTMQTLISYPFLSLYHTFSPALFLKCPRPELLQFNMSRTYTCSFLWFLMLSRVLKRFYGINLLSFFSIPCLNNMQMLFRFLSLY